MALTIKSATDFITAMVKYITDYNAAANRNIDTRIGTVFKDIVVDAPAQGFETAYTDISYTSKLPSLNYADEISETDLDAIAANYGLTRKSSTAAYGYITFITTATTENPPIDNIIINAGTQPRMPASTTAPEVQYQTTETVTIEATAEWLSAHKYLHTDGLTHYAIDSAIQAVTLGSVGNTGYGTITQIVGSVTGISAAKNLASTIGGSDIESNVDFANRIKQKLAGNNIGTEAGIKSLVYDDARVQDAVIVAPGDPDLLRNQYGGSIDIYVIGSDMQTYVDHVYYTGASLSLPLSRAPVSGVTTVTAYVTGEGNHTFSAVDDYDFVKDTSVLADSVKETSMVVFKNTAPFIPDADQNVIITLTFDKLIEDLQLQFDSPENHLVGSDILVRKAYELAVEMTLHLLFFSGYQPQIVTENVRAAISEYVNGLKLGVALNPSDIIGIAEGIAGVDGVELNKLDVVDGPVPSQPERISPRAFEYIRVEAASIAFE